MGHNICPDCGAHLDPGEHCDCKEIAAPGEEDRKAAVDKYDRAYCSTEKEKNQ